MDTTAATGARSWSSSRSPSSRSSRWSGWSSTAGARSRSAARSRTSPISRRWPARRPTCHRRQRGSQGGRGGRRGRADRARQRLRRRPGQRPDHRHHCHEQRPLWAGEQSENSPTPIGTTSRRSSACRRGPSRSPRPPIRVISPNAAIGAMPLLFNAEAFPGAICDEMRPAVSRGLPAARLRQRGCAAGRHPVQLDDLLHRQRQPVQRELQRRPRHHQRRRRGDDDLPERRHRPAQRRLAHHAVRRSRAYVGGVFPVPIVNDEGEMVVGPTSSSCPPKAPATRSSAATSSRRQRRAARRVPDRWHEPR